MTIDSRSCLAAMHILLAVRLNIPVFAVIVDTWLPLPYDSDSFEPAPLDWGFEMPESMISNGRVYLHGVLRKKNNGKIIAGDRVAALSAPFRPPAGKIGFPVVAHNDRAVHRLDVHQDGTVVVEKVPDDASTVSLDGVSYDVSPDARDAIPLSTAYVSNGNAWAPPTVTKQGTRVWLQGLVRHFLLLVVFL